MKYYSQKVYGACSAIIASVLFTIANSFLRLGGEQLGASEVLFWQNIFALLPLALAYRWAPWSWNFQSAHGKQWTFYGFRAGLGVAGNIVWVWGLQCLPFADVTTLGLTGVLFTSLGGWVFFREKVTGRAFS